MENKTPTILYEDKDVLVINKPSGLMVHGDGRNAGFTLADWLIENYPDIKNVGESWESPDGEVIPRPGIVHRLDRETSGVMIVAKTQDSFDFLKGQFKDRKASKKYDVLVYGNPKEDEGLINKPIGRSPSDFRKRSAQPGARGEMREAQTKWKVLARGEDAKTGEKVSHIMAEPLTGRTHQIRVHLKAVHMPVLCDSLYSAGKPCLFGLNRVALHAHFLTINLPSGKEETFEAPIPSDLENAIKEAFK